MQPKHPRDHQHKNHECIVSDTEGEIIKMFITAFKDSMYIFAFYKLCISKSQFKITFLNKKIFHEIKKQHNKMIKWQRNNKLMKKIGNISSYTRQCKDLVCTGIIWVNQLLHLTHRLLQTSIGMKASGKVTFDESVWFTNLLAKRMS